MKGKGTILVLCIALFLSLFLSQNLPVEVNRVIHDTGSVSYDNSQLDKAAFARKTRKLQMPFIANNGQMDEQVAVLCKDLRRHGVRNEGGRDRVCPAGRP